MQIHDILFETNRFNLTEVREHFINACGFGEDLAAWVRDRLNERGIKAGEPYQEDWGWEFPVRDGDRSYYIGVGGTPLNDSSNQGEWRLMVQKRRSLFEKFTGRNKFQNTEPIVTAIHEILKAEPDFSNVHDARP